MLFTTPRLNTRDAEVVEMIATDRAALKHRLGMPHRWTESLRRSTLGRVIRGSNSIEGYKVSRYDVVAAAAGETVEADEQTQLATETYRRAMTLVLQMSKDPTFGWGMSVIKTLHFVMIEYDMDKLPGLWRSGAVFVVNEDEGEQVYEGPEATIVPELMAELLTQLATPDPTVPEIVQAAMAHLNLVMIHPFKDGNGRMARCLQTLVLGRTGTVRPPFSSIEEFLGKNQQAYYDVLARVGRGRWNPENDAHPWIRFCLRAHYTQTQTLLRRVDESGRLYTLLEAEVAKAGLNERTTLALYDAAQKHRVTNPTYRKAAGVSFQVASRDLGKLAKEGLLSTRGKRRGTYYVAGERLREIRQQVTEDREPIIDPFETSTSTVPISATVTVGGDVNSFVVSQSKETRTGPPPKN